MSITVLVLTSFFGCQANIFLAYVPSSCFEVVLCLRECRKLMWREERLLSHSLNIGNFLEEINGIPYYYDLKKEFGFPVLYWKLASIS